MSFEVPRPRDEVRARRREPDPLPDDAPLLERLRAGDEPSFLALVQVHHALLVRVAHGYARRPELAEALASEAWAGLLEALPRLDPRVASVRAHLFRALLACIRARKLHRPASAERAVVEPLRARSAEPRASITPGAPQRYVPAGDPWAGHWARAPRPLALDDHAHAGTARALLLAALDALPERERDAMLLCDLAALTAREAAFVLGASEASVCAARDHARARLREQLELG